MRQDFTISNDKIIKIPICLRNIHFIYKGKYLTIFKSAVIKLK